MGQLAGAERTEPLLPLPNSAMRSDQVLGIYYRAAFEVIKDNQLDPRNRSQRVDAIYLEESLNTFTGVTPSLYRDLLRPCLPNLSVIKTAVTNSDQRPFYDLGVVPESNGLTLPVGPALRSLERKMKTLRDSSTTYLDFAAAKLTAWRYEVLRAYSAAPPVPQTDNPARLKLLETTANHLYEARRIRGDSKPGTREQNELRDWFDAEAVIDSSPSLILP